jgi:multicomponent K+:H+ antiporter subunit D
VNHLIIMPVLLPLLTALMLLLANGRHSKLLRFVSLLSAALLVLIDLSLLRTSSSSEILVYALGNWAPPYGIVLVLDRLSALMLVLTAVLAFFSLCFAARGKTSGDNSQGSSHSIDSLMHFLLMGLNGAFLTGDLFNLFVFFEILLLASYALLLHGGGPARTRAGLHYVILNLAGSSLFLVAVSMLYGLTGTLNMADMAAVIGDMDPADGPLVATAALLLLLVFALKAALVPIYFWLPRAYASASAPVAAIFAVMTKVGVYAIIRVYMLIFGDTAGSIANLALPWLWPVSLITLVLGFIGVLAARDLRTQISYLLIVSVGTLMAGVALHSEAALSATVYYLIHSTLVCGGLYLLADLIGRQRGVLQDRIQSGPAIGQPVLLGSLFFVAALSVVGLPPLSGFIGKVLLLKAAGGAGEAFWLWSAVLLGSLAGMTALSRSGSTIFWRSQESSTQELHQSLHQGPRNDRFALMAVVALLAAGPALAIWGNSVMQFTDALAHQILTPDQYINAVLNHPTVPSPTAGKN